MQSLDSKMFPIDDHERSESDRFRDALIKVRELKDDSVNKRIEFYGNNLTAPRRLFWITGILLIICSSSLPAFASMKELPYHDVFVTVLSVLVASLSGLAAFFRWERSWRENALAKVALEHLCLKWELELSRAENYGKSEERIEHVYMATDDLFTNVKAIVAAEAGTFFQGLKVPSRDGDPK